MIKLHTHIFLQVQEEPVKQPVQEFLQKLSIALNMITEIHVLNAVYAKTLTIFRYQI